jgi:hypothetical protein
MPERADEMPFSTDVRSVSDSAIDKLADRFDDLPRPLLAAIGAGDFAVEQLAILREALFEQLAASPTQAADLPQRARRSAAGMAGGIQAFALQIPVLAQEMVTEIPEKVAEITGDLSADTVRDTVEAYAELVGMVYGSLARRGDRAWSRVRSFGLRPGTVVDAEWAAPKTTSTQMATAAPKSAGTSAG